ncbi:MAG TPA: C25 family cysteine peptidase, partial [bacterium]|nr:C25 family cysteine peptidase [bacterium]
MRKFFLAVLFLLCQSVFADYVDIEIPEINPVENGSEIIPAIDGYELDGTGEKIILPYKKFSFAGKIVKVEVLKKKTVEFMMPLKKGEPLYRLNDYKRVKPVTGENTLYPSVEKFFFIANPTLKGTVSQYSLNLYPVIPAGETRVTKIDKVRIYLENGAKQTMAPTKGRDSLLILTSELVKSKSHELGNFIDAKRADGFRVDIVTEKDYEGGDLTGIERALKIRSFLKKVAGDYYFLLIIANPIPNGNDVPMIISKPNKGEVEAGYEAVPTDMFYAEVTEDIDKNKNGIYGERADKVEISAEFIVGRIPIYYDNVADVDRILERTVRYIKEKPSDAEYRKKMLFPTTIAYYAMQDGQFGMPKMDGAYVVQYLKEKVLDESFTTKTLVETEGSSPSEFIDEEAISYNSMLSNWNEGYGA